MSGIPVHTESPISPPRATAITPQTSYNPTPTCTSTPATTTQSSTFTNGYPQARPGAAAATPTRPMPTTTSENPPAPQPGAAPTRTSAAPSKPARRLSIPPPPKVGEKPQPPSYYATTQPTPTLPATGSSQAYPQQIGLPPPGPAYHGIPPSSTTSTTQTPLFSTLAWLPPQPQSGAAAARSRANTLEHPPGYVQNPQAQEMTPDARFATEQQESANHSSGRSPVLPGYSDSNVGGNAGFGPEEGIWDMAKKLVNQAGEKVQEFEGEVWRKFGDGK